jgi:antitoxin CcdA
MAHTSRSKLPKQSANLSIDSELLKAAREAGVNLSAALEEALTDKVRQAKRKQWLRDNADAIAAYNELVEQEGVFSEGSRTF